MLDILLSPAAKEVVGRDAPGLFAQLPPAMAATSPPSFAAILDLRDVLDTIALFKGGKVDEAKATITLATLDADLRKVPVTAADRAARCARYDDDRPVFALQHGKPHLLLFEKVNGFRDASSIDAAHAAFVALADANGWDIVTTNKGGAITPSVLRHFDAVIWNNNSGDVLTLSQRSALKAYIERGGGFVGVHGAAGDPTYWWAWYIDTLIGAKFAGHPYPNQFQAARVVLDDVAHPIAEGLPHEWSMAEEWYSFKSDPRSTGSQIIATLDETTYDPTFMGKKDLRMGDHPIAWGHLIGKGHVFYSAIGHRPEVYADPIYRQMLTNAITWALKQQKH